MTKAAESLGFGGFKSLKNPGFSTRGKNAEMRSGRNAFPDGAVFIFLQKRKRFFPKNAILTYMPSEWIEHGEVCGPPHTPLGFSIV
jgi:hypothetical protein